jgi:hypothetical protein
MFLCGKLPYNSAGPFKPLKREGHVDFQTSSAYLQVPYGSHNKQGLFPPNSINWLGSVARRDVFPVGYELIVYTGK